MEDNKQIKIKEVLNNSIKIIYNYNGEVKDIQSLCSNKKNETLTLWERTQQKLSNATNIVIFNYFPWRSYNTIQSANLFHHHYMMNDERYNMKLESLIYFSYRSNFSPIINIKTKKIYTSDSGWGCMIRSSQMLLARALYRLYKFRLQEKSIIKDTYDIKIMVIVLFLDCSLTGFDFYCNDMIKKYMLQNNMNNSSHFAYQITPPFSLKTICSIGELFNKTAGEWYSDITMPKVFQTINDNYEIIPQCEIVPFVSIIDEETIISKCFKVISLDQLSQRNIKDKICFKEKYYNYYQSAIIFISVHLGLNSIPIEYYQSIKALFNCDQCIGIIGGQGAYGFYFIGYDTDNLLYLNPHYVQQSVKQNTDDINLDTYNNPKVCKLPFNQMQTAFTIGFQFRSIEEYNQLITFFKEETKWPNSIFRYTQSINPPQLTQEAISFINGNSISDDF